MDIFHQFFVVVALLAPVLLALTAVMTRFSHRWTTIDVKQIAVFTSAIAILSTGVCGFLVRNGMLQSGLVGISDIGFSIRLDAISVIMLVMISLLGFVIIRFSINYLDGEERQDIFIGRLTATLASIHLLVMSGNIGLLFLAWILTSVSLHRLLLFYRERPGAVVAAKKKFILARSGDVALLIAFVLLYTQFGSGDLGAIFDGIQQHVAAGASTASLEGAAIFLVLAALLKSAQFPTHGWLIEIMETPTPVSALLHAGLLNAGPFLIIRMAYVLEATTIAPIVLIAVGGFTALFGSAACMTQTSIKTALGYSSVAHMGFSLMLGGLGVYTAAMLHLVAHSFYKAHAFLSSGSVIEILRASKVNTPKRTGSRWRIMTGVLIALALYVVTSMVWGVDVYEEFSVLAVGAIITMGLIVMFASAIDSKSNATVLLKTTMLAVLVLTAFFALEAGTRHLLASELPHPSARGIGKIIVTIMMIVAFAAIIVFQVSEATARQSFYIRALAIHLRNGLYVNAIFDKIIGAFRIKTDIPARIEKVTLHKKIDVTTLRTEEQPA